MPQLKSQFGFTLVELMVTLAVAAILAALAAPSFADFIDKARLKGVASDVVDFINDARAESVKHNRDVNISFNGTTSAWCAGANAAVQTTAGNAIPAAASCDCRTAGACMVGSDEKTFPTTSDNGVTLSTIPGAITFDSRLGTTSPLGTSTVTLTSPRQKFDLRVTVSPLGQITLCTPSGKPAISEYSAC